MSKAGNIFKYVRGCSFVKVAKESPLWFLAPALVLGGGMAAAVSGYQPLVFDASQYQTQEAQAAELDSTVDAAALESKDGKSSSKTKQEKEEEAAEAAKTAAKSSAKKASALAKATLADGTFTGYSRCTEEDVFDYYLCLTITVKGGKVVNVSDVHGSGTGDKGDKSLGSYDTINDSYLNQAKDGVLPQLKAAGKAGKTPSDVDTVSGATYSSSSMLEAYLDAVSKSAAAAGNKSVVKKKNSGGSKKSNSSANNKKNDNDGGSSDKGDDGGTAPQPDNSGDSGSASDQQELDYGTGTWTAYALCKNAKGPNVYSPYYIGVTVETSGGKVTGISSIFGDDKGANGIDASLLYDANENAAYLNRAINGLNKRKPGVKTQLETIIASGKADGDVDTVTGATYSSRSILDAYRAAIAQAHASTVTITATEGQEAAAEEVVTTESRGFAALLRAGRTAE